MASELLLPTARATDANGNPYSGATWTFYATGTSTPQNVYSNSTLATSLGSTVTADSGGKFVPIYFDASLTYRGVCKDSTGAVTLHDIDPINPSVLATLAASSGSSLIGFIASGAGAVARTVQDKERDVVSLKDFGAVGDGSTDDTTAINAFLAVVGGGKAGFIPDGNYKFTAALTAVTGNNIRIYGPGFLVYGGVSTTPTALLTFGDGTTTYQMLSLEFGGIGSSVTLTGGKGIRIRKYTGVQVDMCVNGPPGYQGNLYEGIWFDTSSTIDLGRSQFYTISRNILWNDGSELHCHSASILGKLVTGQGSGTGVHIAGGCGGFYLENASQLYNEWGVKIDTSVSATKNTQIFLDTGVLDSNKTAAVYVNDAVADSLSKSLHIGCWACSTAAGNGVHIANWNSGKVFIGAAKIINCTAGTGLYIADTSCRVQVSNAARISQNNVGIDAASAVTIYGDPQPFTNTIADFGTNITVSGVRYGVQSITQDPANDWLISSIPNTKTIANGANTKIADGSGLIAVTNPANGDTGVYLVGGAAVALVSTTAATFVTPTTTPAAGKVSVAYNGSTGYNVYNNYGSSQAFIIALLLKTRASI